jgi:Lrp/AsnC family leucine-responsive transcriptional regulator
MSVKLDEFDIRILNLLQRDCRLTSEQVARRTGLSASSVQRRLRRLRARKVIESEVAVVSPEAVGRTLTAVVGVTLEREHPHIVGEFKRLMVETPEVMQCYYVTGDADFILVITAKDMPGYDAFLTRLFSQSKHIKRIQTNVVIQRIKTGLTVPLDEGQS